MTVGRLSDVFHGQGHIAVHGEADSSLVAKKAGEDFREVPMFSQTAALTLPDLKKARWPRARGTDRRGQIPHMPPMAARPAEIATRAVLGHWEGDLMKGVRNGSAVGTLVARITRLVLLARMDGTDAWSARAGFTKKLRHVPALLRKMLTYGLLRRYLPKGTDLSGYTQRELNAIAHRLNTRPRKCLDVATPLEVYAQLGPHAPVALGT